MMLIWAAVSKTGLFWISFLGTFLRSGLGSASWRSKCEALWTLSVTGCVGLSFGIDLTHPVATLWIELGREGGFI